MAEAAAVQISAVLTGFPEAAASLRKIGEDAAQAGKQAAAGSRVATQAMRGQAEGLRKTTSAFTGLRQSVTTFSATLSGTAAILSLFARNNEALQQKLEMVPAASAAAGMAVRTLGAAIRFALTPIGLIVTAIGAAIAVALNWEAVQKSVTAIAQTVWRSFATFITKLVGGLAEVFEGLGELMLGGMTGNLFLMRKGLSGVQAGFATLRDLGVETTTAVTAGIKDATVATYDFLKGLITVKEEIKEIGLTPLERLQAAFGEAMGTLEKDIEAGKKATADLVTAGLTPLEAALDAVGEAAGTLADDIAEGVKAAEAFNTGLDAFGEAMGSLERDITAGQQAAQRFVDEMRDPGLDAFGEAMGNLGRDITEGQQAAQRFVDEGLSPILQGLDALEQSEFGAAAEAQLGQAQRAAESFQGAVEQLQSTWLGTMVTIQDVSRSTWQLFSQGVSDAIGRAIVFGEDLGVAMANVLKNIAANVISLLVQLGVQWAASALLGAVIGAKQLAFDLARHAATTYGGAFAATAGIPVIGPLIAAGVAAAAVAAMLAGSAVSFAAGQAMGAGLGASGMAGFAQGGLEDVPATGTFLLHRGERVLSRRQNVGLEEFMDEGAGGRPIIVQINAANIFHDEIGWAKLMRRIKRELRDPSLLGGRPQRGGGAPA